MVVEIVKDLWPILSVFAVVLGGAAVAMPILMSREDQGPYADGTHSDYHKVLRYQGVGQALYSVSFWIFGDINRDEMKDTFSQAFMLMILVFALLVMTNLLIAIMTDTYDRVRENQKTESLISLAENLWEWEVNFPDNASQTVLGRLPYRLRKIFGLFIRTDASLCPMWCSILLRGDGIDSGEWGGRLKKIREDISALERRLDSRIGGITNLVEKVSLKIDRLGKRMGAGGNNDGGEGSDSDGDGSDGGEDLGELLPSPSGTEKRRKRSFAGRRHSKMLQGMHGTQSMLMTLPSQTTAAARVAMVQQPSQQPETKFVEEGAAAAMQPAAKPTRQNPGRVGRVASVKAKTDSGEDSDGGKTTTTNWLDNPISPVSRRRGNSARGGRGGRGGGGGGGGSRRGFSQQQRPSGTVLNRLARPSQSGEQSSRRARGASSGGPQEEDDDML